jgi:hypothetical protein
MNVHLTKTSTFAALRNPVYRKLWFAILLSGTCVAAQDTAAAWTALGGVLLYFLGANLGFCGERPLLRGGDLRPVAVERVRSGIRVAIGKFPRIILYRRPICPIFPGDSSGTSPERPICLFYFCLTGADTRHRVEGTSTSTL